MSKAKVKGLIGVLSTGIPSDHPLQKNVERFCVHKNVRRKYGTLSYFEVYEIAHLQRNYKGDVIYRAMPTIYEGNGIGIPVSDSEIVLFDSQAEGIEYLNKRKGRIGWAYNHMKKSIPSLNLKETFSCLS